MTEFRADEPVDDIMERDTERVSQALKALLRAKMNDPSIDLNKGFEGVLARIDDEYNNAVSKDAYQEYEDMTDRGKVFEHLPSKSHKFVPDAGPSAGQYIDIPKGMGSQQLQDFYQMNSEFAGPPAPQQYRLEVGEPKLGDQYLEVGTPVIEDDYERWSSFGDFDLPLPELEPLPAPENMKLSPAETSKILHAGVDITEQMGPPTSLAKNASFPEDDPRYAVGQGLEQKRKEYEDLLGSPPPVSEEPHWFQEPIWEDMNRGGGGWSPSR